MRGDQLLAQNINVGGQSITGPLKGINTLSDVINKIVPVVIYAAIIILFFVLVWGGFNFLTSAGNPEKIKSARAKITTGIIGFILLIVSYIIVKLISTLFGIGQGLF